MNSILIIDDEEVNFIINSKILSIGKFADKVVYHSSGASGLQYLQSLADTLQEWPTHIFVDINMPEMDGFEFIEAYKCITEKINATAKVFICHPQSVPKTKGRQKNSLSSTNFSKNPLRFRQQEWFSISPYLVFRRGNELDELCLFSNCVNYFSKKRRISHCFNHNFFLSHFSFSQFRSQQLR